MLVLSHWHNVFKKKVNPIRIKNVHPCCLERSSLPCTIFYIAIYIYHMVQDTSYSIHTRYQTPAEETNINMPSNVRYCKMWNQHVDRELLYLAFPLLISTCRIQGIVSFEHLKGMHLEPVVAGFDTMTNLMTIWLTPKIIDFIRIYTTRNTRSLLVFNWWKMGREKVTYLVFVICRVVLSKLIYYFSTNHSLKLLPKKCLPGKCIAHFCDYNIDCNKYV